MLKTLILSLIVIICSLIGYIYGEGYKRRFLELTELKRILIDIENEIIYNYSSLPETIIEMGRRAKEPLNKLFVSVGEELTKGTSKSVYDTFQSIISKERENFSLKDDDFTILLDLSKSLGETDIYGQEQIFRFAKEKINRVIEEAHKDCNKNTKIYRALGIGFGVMLVIFLV